MKNKSVFIALGITTFSLALGVVAYSMGEKSFVVSRSTDESVYTLTLNHDNAPAGLPENLSGQFGVVTTKTVKTINGNDIPLAFTLAKAYSDGFVTLGNHGTIYNFGEALGRFKGIVSIKAVFDGTLKFEAGNYELQNGGAYLDVVQDLSTGEEYELANPVRYFKLSAGDSYSNIQSITLKYTCDGAGSAVDTNHQFNVQDFNAYTGTGSGYDTNGGGHNYYATTNMRSSLYGDYRNTGTDSMLTNDQLLSGTSWTVMGGSDYVTYASSVDGQSNVALLKGTNSNNMRYIQMKQMYGEPTIIGKGNTLSIKMHGAYSNTSASSNSTQNVVVKLMAFYDKKFDKASSANTATLAEYTVFANSGWAEYKMDLDPTKEYYGFGVCIVMKGLSGTLYLPIDDVKIYTENRTKTAPSGNYFARITVSLGSSFTVPTVISVAEKIGKIAVFINNKDAVPTSFNMDQSGNFTIDTSGDYSGYKYGSITGKWDITTDRLINVRLNGQVGSVVQNNGSIVMTIPTLSLDCDGDNATMKTIFKRQYWNGSAWSVDTGNADRMSADVINVATGKSSLRPRSHASYRTGVLLNSDLNTKAVQSICMWIYNPGAEGQIINFTVYRTTNYTSTASSDRYVFDSGTPIPTGWSFYCMGFNHNTYFKFGTDTLHNINLNVKENRIVSFDCISLYN